MFIRFSFILILCTFLVGFSAQESHAAKLCDVAEDTAGLQKCLRNRLDHAQGRLKKAFTQIDQKIEADKKVQLKDLQKSWLDYRDQECMWEAEQASSESLKVINELSCMAVITENRATLLESAYSDYDATAPREFSNIPRWTNVLNKDYAGYVWDIEDAYLADLNCDDREEIIVTGASYKSKKIESNIEDDTAVYFEKNVAIAIIQNPDVGRPDITNFTFPITKDGKNQSLCDKKIKFLTIEKPLDKQADGELATEESQACRAVLKVSQTLCEDNIIEVQDNKFILQEKITTEELSEEKPK